MTDSTIPDRAGDDKPNLGHDGTIPNSDDGIAVTHDPEASNFNQEEDQAADADTDAATTE